MSTALRSAGLLDVLYKYDCKNLGHVPCVHAQLHRLVTAFGEKGGLNPGFIFGHGLVNATLQTSEPTMNFSRTSAITRGTAVPTGLSMSPSG